MLNILLCVYAFTNEDHTNIFLNWTLGLFQSGNMPVGIFTTIHAKKWEGLNQVIKDSVNCLDSTKEVCMAYECV